MPDIYDTGFRLFTSNHLVALGRELASNRLAEPARFRRAGFFEEETLCVATQGMATWLEHFLVEQGHVVANLRFVFIRNAIDAILAAFKQGDSRYRPELFQEEVLIWRICRLLETPAVLAQLPILESYLSAGAAAPEALPVRRYQLATRLAQLYYNYMAFVPEMLHPEMQRHPKTPDAAAAWQVTLWGMLCDRREDGCRIISPAQALLEFVRPETALPDGFYHPVTFFGVSAMAPYFLVVLKKLATVQPVNFYYLNHCDELWDDVKTDSRQWKACEATSLSNTILAANGLQGSEFFKAVLDLSDGIDWEEHPGEAPEAGGGVLQWSRHDSGTHVGAPAPAGQPLLREVQERILRNSDDPTGEEMLPAGSDDSLSIHNCFNDVREVEALHDCLLRLFEEYTSRGTPLSTSDIIVMAPDIAAFAPAIQAVFDRGPLKGRYCISDRSIRQANLLARCFLDIMTLPRSDFEVSRISRLLDSPPLRRRFGLEDDDVAVLREWLLRAGIRWGQDASQRKGRGDFEEFSWQHGLDRMLLKLALDSDGGAEGPSFGGLAPMDIGTGKENHRRLDSLIRLYNELKAFAAELTAVDGGLSIAEWREVLLERRSSFFLADSDSAQEYAQLGRSITDMEAALAAAGYDVVSDRLPYGVVLAALTATLEAPAPGEPFLNGKVTFCSLLPMRGIPRRVIALMGMDAGEFPRQNDATAYNLMGRRKENSLLKYYDRTRSTEDRFTFLEALMSAQDYLLFFYRGQSDMDLQELAPAAPLAELREYLQNIRNDGIPEIRHRLNAFDATSFGSAPPPLPKRGDGLYTGALLRHFSYNRDMAAVAALRRAPEAASNAPLHHWQEAYGLPAVPPVSWDGGKVTLTMEELEHFLKEPASSYACSRLGFPRERWEEEPLADYEPFQVDALATAKLKRRLAETMGDDADGGSMAFPQELREDTSLPVGRLGEACLRQNQIDAWIPDAAFRAEWNAQEASAPQEYSLELGTIALAEAFPWPPEEGPMPREASALPALEVRLTGCFKALPGGLRTCLYVSTPSGRHLAPLYLKHLMLCACGGTQAEDASSPDVTTCYLAKPTSKMAVWEGCHHMESSPEEPALPARALSRRDAIAQLRRIAGLALLNRLYPMPLFGKSSWSMACRTKADSLLAEDLDGANAAWLFGTEELPKRTREELALFQCTASCCYGGVGETAHGSTEEGGGQ